MDSTLKARVRALVLALREASAASTPNHPSHLDDLSQITMRQAWDRVGEALEELVEVLVDGRQGEARHEK